MAVFPWNNPDAPQNAPQGVSGRARSDRWQDPDDAANLSDKDVIDTGEPAPTVSIRPDAVYLAPEVQVAGPLDKTVRAILGKGKTGEQVEKKTDDLVEGAVRSQTGEADDLLRDKYGIDPSMTQKLEGIDFNFERIQTDDDVKSLIDEVSEVMAPEIDNYKRGTRTFEQIKHDAALLDISPQQLLDMQPLRAEEFYRARNTLVSLAEKVTELAKKAADPRTGTEADLVKMRQALQLYAAVQMHVKGLQTETARTLSAMRIMAESEAGIQRQFDELLEGLGGHGYNKRVAQMLADPNLNPTQRAKLLPKVWKAKRWDMFMEYYINALLSSPQTHIVNFGTALGAVAMGMPEHLVAGVYGMAHRAMGGEGGVYAQEALTTWTGLTEGVVAGGRNAWQALKTGEPSDHMAKIESRDMRRAITAEQLRRLPEVQRTGNLLGLLEEGSTTAAAFDLIADWTVRGPSRAMMTEDEFVKGLAYYAELNRRATRQVLTEGLTGDAAKRRLAEIKSNPEKYAPDVHFGSVDFAREVTFQLPLGEKGKAIQGLINNVPVMRLFFPFVRTPINIVKYVAARTPAGLLMREVRQDLMGKNGAAAQQMALSKITIGSALGYSMVTLAAEGYITGGGPTDYRLKRSLEATGWQEYSIYNPVTQQYHSYRRADPFAITMGMAADLNEVWAYMSEDEQNTAASVLAVSIYRNLTSKTWLTGMAELSKMVEDMENGTANAAERFVSRLASSAAIPAGVGFISRSFVEGGEVMRDIGAEPIDDLGFEINPGLQFVEQMINGVKRRTPGLGSDLPPVLDFWGRDVVYKPGFLANFVPMYTSDLKYDPARLEAAGLPRQPDRWARLVHPISITDEQLKAFVKEVGIDGEIIRLGTPTGRHPDKIGGVPLTPWQEWQYVRAVNTDVRPNESVTLPGGEPFRLQYMTLKQALEAVVKTEHYLLAADDPEMKWSKPAILRRIVSYYRHEAETDPRTGLGGADRIMAEQNPALWKLIAQRRRDTAPMQELLEGIQ